MKGLTLVLALLLISSVAYAATETAKMDVYGYTSFIGPPIVPITDTYPNSPVIFGANGVDIEYTDVLTRFDAPSQNPIDYLFFDPNQQYSLLLGEGYRVDRRPSGVSNTPPVAVTYNGVQDGVPDASGTMTDMWVSLPGYQLDNPTSTGGLHWISCPFNHAISFNKDPFDGANILVTDGNTVRTLIDAASAAPLWIEEPWGYLDGPTQNVLQAGWFTGVYDDDYLRPGLAYTVRTKIDNLALIIPAY